MRYESLQLSRLWPRRSERPSVGEEIARSIRASAYHTEPGESESMKTLLWHPQATNPHADTPCFTWYYFHNELNKKTGKGIKAAGFTEEVKSDGSVHLSLWRAVDTGYQWVYWKTLQEAANRVAGFKVEKDGWISRSTMIKWARTIADMNGIAHFSDV